MLGKTYDIFFSKLLKRIDFICILTELYKESKGSTIQPTHAPNATMTLSAIPISNFYSSILKMSLFEFCKGYFFI